MGVPEVASTQPPPMPKSTPLLEALKAEKSAQKDRESILRNHPHYKEAAAPSKKEEAKKRSNATSPSKSGEVHSTLGKKATKKAAATQKHAQLQANVPHAKSGSAPAAEAPAHKVSQGGSSKSGRGGRQQPQLQLQEPQLLKRPTTPSHPTPPTQSPSIESPTTLTCTPIPPNTTPTTQPVATGATGSRRPRPVVGLGNRHFVAALSGAGVAKAKRERHTDKDKGKDSVGDGGSLAEASTAENSKDTGRGKERDSRRREDKATVSSICPQHLMMLKQ